MRFVTSRGDDVALGVVLVDGFRQIAPLVASINIPAGHELAERVQDPLLRLLIAGGALGRVVRRIGGFPGSLGARFAAFGRCGIGTFASTLIGRRRDITGVFTCTFASNRRSIGGSIAAAFASRLNSTAAFTSRRLGIGTRRRAPGIRRGANNLDGGAAGQRRFARALRQR